MRSTSLPVRRRIDESCSQAAPRGAGTVHRAGGHGGLARHRREGQRGKARREENLITIVIRLSILLIPPAHFAQLTVRAVVDQGAIRGSRSSPAMTLWPCARRCRGPR